MPTGGPDSARRTAEGSRGRGAPGALGLLVALWAAVLAPAVSAQPVTGHPRLWITAADLPRLRSWAVPTNPVYAQGLKPALDSALVTYQSFFPGGQPASPFPDGGSSNWEQYPVEAYAEFFAFHSLVDPDPSARVQYAQYARNLLMHGIDQAALGAAAGQPYRDPDFAVYNRSRWWGEGWALTVDWIHDAVDAQGHPILTAEDRAKVRTVFLRWVDECLNAATSGNEHPQPVGVLSDPQLLADTEQLRWALNNYYHGHARHVTLMSLALDPSEDPGGTLTGHVANATGAWLYQIYALLEKAPTVVAAYGLPPGTTGLGMGSGGASAEGFEYGTSISHVLESLLALRTAGYDDVALSGPQIDLIRSGYWDLFVQGFLGSLSPASRVHPSVAYLGPLYQMSAYGDVQHLYITQSWIEPFGALSALDRTLGNTARMARSRWVLQHVIEGGAAGLLGRVANIWGNAYATFSILQFMAFDPGAPVEDPRTGAPTSFWDPSSGRLLARTDWGTEASLFAFRGSWKTISHQVGDAGGFDFLREGEWLTKELSGYSSSGVLGTPQYKNSLSIQNHCDCPSGQPPLAWFEGTAWTSGGQWVVGAGAGDPTVLGSAGTGWAYVHADLTNLYNRPDVWVPQNAALDVTHASRSLVWLAPDHVVVYDRAETATAGLFKRFHLNFVASPVVAGSLVTETLPSGQQLFVRTLLPAAAQTTVEALDPADLGGDDVAELEPSTYRMTVEDPSRPAAVRFLHVLGGADAGGAAEAVQRVTSTGGTAFDGAAVAGRVALFPVDATAPFTSLAYTAPAGTRQHLIGGLTPNGTYDASLQAGGGGIAVLVVPGTTVRADPAGLLVLPPQTPARFHTLAPCRLVDTRGAAGPLGGPALDGGAATRTFALAGTCGVPGDATAVSLNVTVANPAAAGHLRLFAAGTAAPLASAINFRAGQVRANNAILSVSSDGSAGVTVRNDAAGPTDLVLDVNGFFR